MNIHHYKKKIKKQTGSNQQEDITVLTWTYQQLSVGRGKVVNVYTIIRVSITKMSG